MDKARLQAVGILCARILIALILFAPIAVYIYIFGISISDDHDRWGQMGSAMSGIYGPVLTVLTLCVLVFQVRMQSESNKHVYDQSHLQLAHDDLTFYLCRLEIQMKELRGDGVTLNNFLQSNFAFAPQETLRQAPLTSVAQQFNFQYPAVLSTWHAISAIYAGLSAVKESAYELHYATGRSKAIALLSYPTCIAMDKYSFSLCRGDDVAPVFFEIQ